MAKETAKKLAKALADQAEAKRIRDYINKYQVYPENYIAKLGQRSAQQFVLKDPTANNVRSWQVPNLNVLGTTFDPVVDDPEVRARYLKSRAAGESDELRDLTFDQSGYNLADKNTLLAGKISLSPEATSRNSNTLEHEYMHRGLQELNKSLPYYEKVSSGEKYPYLYPEVYPDTLKRNPYLPNASTYKERYDKPNENDIRNLNNALDKAKEEYERRYTSGPSGGMPYEFQPHLGDKPPPGIVDRIKIKTKNSAQKLSEILSSIRFKNED